jgi:hypothetical protein
VSELFEAAWVIAGRDPAELRRSPRSRREARAGPLVRDLVALRRPTTSVVLRHVMIDELFARLREPFPRHVLIADLLSAKFLDRYSPELEPTLAAHGLRFATRPQVPAEVFESRGYTHVDSRSVTATGSEKPPWFARPFMRELFRGNVVCVARRS